MPLAHSTSDPLSSTFAALADPTRRAILARLIEGHASVTELAEPFEMSLPAVSKHLKVLERAGLISRGREAQWRPCRLTANPLKDVSDWVEHYRRFWTQSLDRLDDYLRDLQAKTSMETSTTTTESKSSTTRNLTKNSKEKPNDRD
jgi:DNA-binding transcriptional ArsR family regulator